MDTIAIDYRGACITSANLDLLSLCSILSETHHVMIYCAGVETPFAPVSDNIKYLFIESMFKLKDRIHKDNTPKLKPYAKFYRWAGPNNNPSNRCKSQKDAIEIMKTSKISSVILGTRLARRQWKSFINKGIAWVHSIGDVTRAKAMCTKLPVMTTRFDIRLPKQTDLSWSPFWTIPTMKFQRIPVANKKNLVAISGTTQYKIRRYRYATTLYHRLKDMGADVLFLESPSSPAFSDQLRRMEECKAWVDLSTTISAIIPALAAQSGSVVYSTNLWAKTWTHPIDWNTDRMAEDIMEALSNNRRCIDMVNHTTNNMRSIDTNVQKDRLLGFLKQK